MSSPRSIARLAGLLYFVTHVTSVAAVALYGGSALDPEAGLAGRNSVLLGGLLEVVLAAAVVGTSVALYPLVRRHAPGLAVAYVALRTLEASVILTGVVVLLPAVASPALAGSPGLSAEVVAGLRLVHDWTFLVGPGLVAPINTVVIAWLLLRHGLVLRAIPILGLVGAPLVAAANLGVMFGLNQPQPWAAVPIFLWEISLALHLIIRGVRSAGEGQAAPVLSSESQAAPAVDAVEAVSGGLRNRV
ncbi:protein of unknown function [Raineyella antarctica]|uniref:DUF4386 domain-containing protein n=1 Tax=Raineyella antarctica TaxID=1577474 RepID=A0A1G6GF36_9ACTN|nr:DUF4386 domain-containing protein [Raineyella antarctica]SDB80453.1 protein of unknown function [Raineyella antarctica]